MEPVPEDAVRCARRLSRVLMSILYKRQRKVSIFTDFHYGCVSAGPENHSENGISTRRLEIKAWNWCQRTQLGVLEDYPESRRHSLQTAKKSFDFH